MQSNHMISKVFATIGSSIEYNHQIYVLLIFKILI